MPLDLGALVDCVHNNGRRHRFSCSDLSVILGVAQSIGAQINPSLQLLAGHFVFLLVLAVRPQGLLPRMTE